MDRENVPLPKVSSRKANGLSERMAVGNKEMQKTTLQDCGGVEGE